VRAALPGWIAARVITGLALLFAVVAKPRWPVELPGTAQFARSGLLGWDADWYRRIALHGYDGVPDQGLRFFPLLPQLARILGLGTSIGVGIALLVLANGPALGVGALTHRLIRLEGGDAALGRLAATLVALAPPAFVLVMGYTEAIALCALLGGIIAARRGAWGVATACGLLAGLARPTGVLMGVPLLLIALASLRGAGWAERGRRALAVASPALGALPYLVWAQIDRGDWYAPYRVQSLPGLRGGFLDPFSRIGRALATVAGGGVGVDGHDLLVPVAVALLVPAVRRWSPPLAALAVVTMVVALSAENLGSFERYVWASVVPVLTVAWLCRGPRARKVAPAIAGTGMAVLASLAFLGYYVP
jgi:hypothetical protein